MSYPSYVQPSVAYQPTIGAGGYTPQPTNFWDNLYSGVQNFWNRFTQRPVQPNQIAPPIGQVQVNNPAAQAAQAAFFNANRRNSTGFVVPPDVTGAQAQVIPQTTSQFAVNPNVGRTGINARFGNNAAGLFGASPQIQTFGMADGSEYASWDDNKSDMLLAPMEHPFNNYSVHPDRMLGASNPFSSPYGNSWAPEGLNTHNVMHKFHHGMNLAAQKSANSGPIVHTPHDRLIHFFKKFQPKIATELSRLNLSDQDKNNLVQISDQIVHDLIFNVPIDSARFESYFQFLHQTAVKSAANTASGLASTSTSTSTSTASVPIIAHPVTGQAVTAVASVHPATGAIIPAGTAVHPSTGAILPPGTAAASNGSTITTVPSIHPPTGAIIPAGTPVAVHSPTGTVVTSTPAVHPASGTVIPAGSAIQPLASTSAPIQSVPSIATVANQTIPPRSVSQPVAASQTAQIKSVPASVASTIPQAQAVSSAPLIQSYASIGMPAMASGQYQLSGGVTQPGFGPYNASSPNMINPGNFGYLNNLHF